MKDLYIIVVDNKPVMSACGAVIYYPSKYDAAVASKELRGAVIMTVAERQAEIG